MEWIWILVAFLALVVFSLTKAGGNTFTPKTTDTPQKGDKKTIAGNTVTVSLAEGTYNYNNVKISAGNESLGKSLMSMIRDFKTSNDPRYIPLLQQVQSVKDDFTRDFFDSMTSTLMLRNGYANLEMAETNRAKYNNELNLTAGETVLYKYKSAALFTIQKVFTEITYGGVRVNQGVFRAGSGTINSRSVEGLNLSDNGCLYITNKRLIFISNSNKATVVNLTKILGIAKFEEDGLLFTLENSNPIMINFNANFTYNSLNGYFDDSRLEAYNVLDSLIHV